MKANEFLINHNMSPEMVGIEEYSEMFLKEMRAGLEGNDGLPMIPTYLGGSATVPINEPVAVIDAGGTNFRCALLTFTESGYSVDGLVKTLMPGVKNEATWDEFIDFISEALLPIMDKTNKIGFCFSYYAEVTPEIDGKNPGFTKQVKISGSEGKHLCAELTKALEKKGFPGKRAIILNDTVAVQLGVASLQNLDEYSDTIGLVAGTGINTCCSLPRNEIKKLNVESAEPMIINMETAYMCKLPRGDADVLVDNESVDPGKCQYEKMTSGAYLGEITRKCLCIAHEEGLLPDGAVKLGHIDSSVADNWCRGEIDDSIASTDEQKKFVQEISNQIFNRSAKLVASNIVAIEKLKNNTSEKNMCVCAEGSLFMKSKIFRQKLEELLDEYLENSKYSKCSFRTADETTLLGAAAAALLN